MNNDIKKNNGRKPVGIMKAGAIIAIVGNSILLFFALLFFFIILAVSKTINNTNVPQPENVSNWVVGFAIFTLIFGLLIAIPSLIFNSLLLRGKLKSNVAPGVLALISLGVTLIGIIVGILILTGKFEDQIDDDKDNNFFKQNFNLPHIKLKNKNNNKTPETALILAASNGHTEIVKELLKNKTKNNFTDQEYQLALTEASKNGYTEIVKQLLKSKTTNDQVSNDENIKD